MLRRVKASAGSGKTFALTQFFLKLLAGSEEQPLAACVLSGDGEGYGWQEIMAITFTNKAAAEMKARVISSLKRRALGQEADGPAAALTPRQASRWLTLLLRGYQQFNIRTIDSLLHLCLRLGALDLGLSPDFTVEFDDTRIFQDLFDAFLFRAEQGGHPERHLLEAALDSLIFREGKAGFRLDTPLRERSQQAFEYLSGREELRLAAAADLERGLEESHGRLQAARESLMAAMHDADLSGVHHFSTFLTKLAAGTPGGALPDSKFAEKDSLEECLSKASRSRTTPAATARYQEFKAAYTDYRRKRHLISQALHWLPFAAIGQVLARDFTTYPHRSGIVSGRTWGRAVTQLLRAGGGVTLALCRLGANLRYLLIDEFQDTSREQWGALLPLARECRDQGGGLLLVGDVKQAIYGWRGGDWQLLDEAARDLGGQPPAAEYLPHNWRSRQTLVDFTNRIFGQLQDREICGRLARALAGDKAPPLWTAELADTLENAYRQAEQTMPAAPEREGGYVELRELRGRHQEDLEEQAAAALHQILRELQGRRPWGDVAVLVRRNQEAEEVSRWLIDWGIPLVTENSLHLADHPLIRQLLAFLSFLDYPDHDLDFWNFVSGAEVFQAVSGLGPEVLVAWLARQTGPSLYKTFQRDFPGPWRTWIEPFYRQSGLMSPYDVIQEIIKHFQLLGRYPEDEIFLRRFLELVHLAEEHDCQSLAAFLDYWRRDGVKERAPLPENVEAVRVMTIHKAKGLEFPVVIVPFHHWPVKTERLTETAWGDDWIIVPLTTDLGENYWRYQRDALLESLNLVYVAWTRAVDEFYAFITRNDSQKGGSPLTAGLAVLLACLGPAESGVRYTSGAPRPARRQAVEPASGEPLKAFKPEAHVPEAGFMPMAWLPGLKIFRNNLEEEATRERRRGELAHLALEYVRPRGDPAADARRAVDLALAYAPRPHLDPGMRVDLEKRLTWVLGVPELVSLKEQGQAEVEILDEQGAVYRLDHLTVTDTEAVVLEYKTGKPSDDHGDQVRWYLRLLAGLPELRREPGRRSVRGLLIYLDEEQIVEVSGDLTA